MSTLNRKTPIPLYYQLIEMIRKDIETGVLKPGDVIPSERELSEKYQISRPTVRQAIKELAYEGLLNREKGKGTFVSRPKFNYGFIQQFSTFYDDMAEKGYQVHTKVLNIEVRNDLPNIGKILNIAENDPIICIERMRYVEGEPIVKVSNFIPFSLCPDLVHEDLTDKSLYRTLFEKYHLRAFRAEITLEATVADNLDSKVLEIPEGAPVIFMKNITFTPENTIMDYFQSRFRGDKGKIKVEVFSK
ncbi:MAG: GntR family transcriptional regulator [Candidatus Atribacteria bacterium]|nr:GntR family transcriptional regulator [Candidatus Atribacteria bacterium]